MNSALTWIVLATAVFTVTATLPKFRRLQEIPPENVGLYHTDAFQSLADKLTLQDLENRDAMIDHLVDVAASYCSNDECIEQTFSSAADHVNNGMIDPYTEFPEDFGPTLKEYLESVRSTILSGTIVDGEEMIDELMMIQSKMQDDSTMDEDEKFIGIAATSIAVESTKLWSSVFSDAEHPLRDIRTVNSQDRNLQTTIELNISREAALVIAADVFGLILTLGIPIGAILGSYLAYEELFPIPPKPSTSPSAAPSD